MSACGLMSYLLEPQPTLESKQHWGIKWLASPMKAAPLGSEGGQTDFDEVQAGVVGHSKQHIHLHF